MNGNSLQQRLSDLIAFQCVLVALRGVVVDASEEMMWQTLLAALCEQYGLRRVWYGRYSGSRIRPVVSVPLNASCLAELPEEMEESSPFIAAADLNLPVLVEDVVEGRLVADAGGIVSAERAEQISILVSEGTTMLAQHRSRLRQAEAIQRSEERYRILFNGGNDAVFIFGPGEDGSPPRILQANDVACQRLGYSREELLTRSMVDIHAPEARPALASIMEVLAVERHVLVETEHLARSGRRIPTELNARTIEFGGQSVVLGIARDISERKKADAERARLSTAMEQAGEGIVVADADGTIEYVNPAFIRMTGYSAAEAVGQGMRLFDSIEQVPKLAEALWKSVLSGDVWRGELVNRRKDGSPYLEEVTVNPVRDSRGATTALIALKQDVTGRRAAEKAQAFLASIVESSADAIIGTDLDGTVLSWNPGAESLYGYTEAEMIGNMISILLPPELPGESRQILTQIERGVRIPAFETVRLRKDGTRVDVSLAVSPIRNAAGSVIGLAGIARDISAQKRAAQVLAESEVRYRELFEESHDMVFTHDLKGNFTSVNRAGQEICGYSQEELLTMNARDLLTPESVERVGHWIDSCNPKRPPVNREVGIMTRDGRNLTLEVSASLLYREGNCVGLRGIARDVSARKKVEENLRRAKESAEAASRAKGQFMANMSHEIRTPMNGIIGMTELALETNLTQEQREYLRTVKHSAESLLGIINGILDFSKIEAGKFDLEQIDFDLRENLRSTTKAFTPLAEDKGLKLSCEVSPRTPDRVVGDPTRLRQIVVNLLGNAIKFTSRGEVGLQVDTETFDGENVVLHFVVSDTGVGIPQAKHQLIFEPFSQADGATTRKFGGTGLGLTISARLIEKMGGRVWVESEEGCGSRFHFTVRLGRGQSAGPPMPAEEVLTDPPEQRHATEGARREKSGDADPRAGIRVLVAEDNAVNRTLAVRILEKQGHKVSTAGDGLEALLETEKQDFDVVLMDVQMPGVDGVQATKLIRDREKQTGKHVNIVALTALAMAADRETCMHAGMDAYISKPINKAELLSTIENLTLGKTEPGTAAQI